MKDNPSAVTLKLAASMPRWQRDSQEGASSPLPKRAVPSNQSLSFALPGVFNLWLRLSALPLSLDGKEPPRYGRTPLVLASPSPAESPPAAPSRRMKLCHAVTHALTQRGVCRVCCCFNCYFLSSLSFFFF